MTRKRYFDTAELAARGWHPRRLDWFLGQPVKTIPGRGDVYAAVDVHFAEVGPEWAEQMRLEFEEDAEDERRLAANRAHQEALAAKPTTLYRLFDTAGTLLYIGITTNLRERFKGHRTGSAREEPKPWWPEVAGHMTERFASRPEAEAAETFAIVTERPRYNKAKADAWFRWQYRNDWLLERLRNSPAPNVRRLAAKLDAHAVSLGHWWRPRPCNRLLAERATVAARYGTEMDSGGQEVLPTEAVLLLTRHHRGECRQCRQPYPCAAVRSVAARFCDDPQYAPLWGEGDLRGEASYTGAASTCLSAVRASTTSPVASSDQ